jgi:hypothetical protein
MCEGRRYEKIFLIALKGRMKNVLDRAKVSERDGDLGQDY